MFANPFDKSAWLSSSVVGGVHTGCPVPYFRTSFYVSCPVRKAQLFVTALGVYEAEINGTAVSDHVFSPGWTDFSKRAAYQVFEIGSALTAGENVIGILLGDGWYAGTIGWELNRQNYGDRPCFIARIEIELSDGTTSTVVANPDWKTTTGPILESDFLMGEAYDARLELGDWSQPGYDDSSWEAVRVVEAPTIELNLSKAPPVRRIEELHPVSGPQFTSRNGKEARIFDLGQNFAGRARIKVKAARGRTLSLRFAEILNSDGTLYTDNLRGARATDYYTCKGDDLETWEPRFTFHGFRYVEVGGQHESDLVEVAGIVLHSDMEPTGRFACSSPLLNQLQHNIVWGQKSNFLEVPTDCPQRDERLGWTGDAQVFIRTAAFNMNVRGFFHKWMQDVRDAQGPRGGIPPVVPKILLEKMEDGGPAWSDAAIICPWTIYLCYGDREILESHYNCMVRYHAFLEQHQSLNSIRSHPDLDTWKGFGDWLALDGGGKIDGITPKDLIGTAFYAYVTEILCKTAGILGKPDDAKRFSSIHREIITAFNRRFVTPDGLIVSGTQTAYILALQFKLLPEEMRPLAAKSLAKDVEERGCHLATGFVGTPYILEVLEEYGYLDTAYRLMEQELFPSWLFSVKNGATTIWERWDGWTPEKGPQDKAMNSYNHYAYGAVGGWMYRSVAGLDLDPEEPGYRHIIFRPRPGGSLTWAEAELVTPHGKASIRWEKTPGGLKLDLNVPDGARASLIPPEGYGSNRSLASGHHCFVLPPETGNLPGSV